MSVILTVLKDILNHPLNKDHKLKTLVKVIKWQIGTKINPYPVIYPFTQKAKLIVAKGMHGATGNLYCGLHEYADMAFLLHFLRKGDLFADVGANIGSYTVLAMTEGEADVIAFEPSPETYKNLQKNILVNDSEANVQTHNIALGSKEGKVTFTKSNDSTNRVATNQQDDVMDVPIDALDNVLNGRIPTLIKIDVEGYETEVLNGAKRTLENNDLKGIIVELNGSGRRYGYDESIAHNSLLNLGFVPYTYNVASRTLTVTDKIGEQNTIYLRDIDFVRKRITTAKAIELTGYGPI